MEDEEIIRLSQQRSFQKNNELYKRMIDLVHEYDGEVSPVEVLGTLVFLMHKLIQGNA